MPNHNTPHWTDGDGIGKKLTGQALNSRLKKLADTANENHLLADKHHREAWQGWLGYAREAGEALIEAERRLGHRTKWSKWRKANFIGSKETACDYARVAREWNNPKVIECRELGIPIDSVNKIKKLLRGEPLTRKKPKGKIKNDRQRDFLRDQLKRDFAAKLKELTDEEVTTLAKPDLTTFDALWGNLYERLRRGIEIMNEGIIHPYQYMHEPDEEESEEQQEKYAARRKCKKRSIETAENAK